MGGELASDVVALAWQVSELDERQIVASLARQLVSVHVPELRASQQACHSCRVGLLSSYNSS